MSNRSEFDSMMGRDMEFQQDSLASPLVTSPAPRPMSHNSSTLSPFPAMMTSSLASSQQQSPLRKNTSSFDQVSSPIEELIHEARASHSSLLASICSYVTESTETHLLSTTSSIKQYYENVLEQQQLEATNKIKQLESELKEMTAKFQHLQGEYAQLEDKLEKRTEKITQYINDHHIQRSDVTNTSSLVSYFLAWKSISKRHSRARKLEKFVDRSETESLLHQYFVHLQVNRLHEKAERKLSEVKFKHETLSNEMARGYETEIAQLKQQNDEAQHQIQVEIEKRKHLEADMRTLFLQSMSQMNMQALSLFRKVEGSIDMSAFRDIAPFNGGPQSEEKTMGDIFQQDSTVSNANLSINVAHDLDVGSSDSPTSLSPQPRSVISTSSSVPFFSPMQMSSSGFQQTATSMSSQQQNQMTYDHSPQPILLQQQQKQQYQFNVLPTEQVKDKFHYDRLSDMYKNAIPSTQANKTPQSANPPSSQPFNKSTQRTANIPNKSTFQSSIGGNVGRANSGQPIASAKSTLISARRAATAKK